MNNTFPTSKTSASSRLARRQRAVVVALAVWATLVPGFVLFAVWKNPVHRAVLGMAWGLILLWIGGGGLIMWHWRDPWDRLAAKVRLPWMLKFVLGCTALALIEEAVTTLMTNCAPLFGVRVGEAYITSSANYFDVVLYHSVVVFVPLFVGWAVMLRFWTFSPFTIFLLFGISGTLCETLSFGLQNLGNLLGCGYSFMALWSGCPDGGCRRIVARNLHAGGRIRWRWFYPWHSCRWISCWLPGSG